MMGLCVVVLVATFGAWAGVSWVQREKTSVSWSGPLQCSGSRVTHERVEGAGETVQAMRLQPSMRCRLPVKIENHGWLPVEVASVSLPYMGPGGGAAVQVTMFDGHPPQEKDADGLDPIDAVFATHRKLAAGGVREFVIEFTFRPDGCTSNGVMSVWNMPQVDVKALGRSGTRRAEEVIGFRGTKVSDNCPS